MRIINISAQTVSCQSVNMAFDATVHLHFARIASSKKNKNAPVSDTQHTFMEIYFGPAVIGSSEPDPEALRLGLRSECSPTTKRQSGESVIKSLAELMRGSDLNAHVRLSGQEVSDLLIGRGKEGVYISGPKPLRTIRLLDIPSVLVPVKN